MSFAILFHRAFAIGKGCLRNSSNLISNLFTQSLILGNVYTVIASSPLPPSPPPKAKMNLSFSLKTMGQSHSPILLNPDLSRKTNIKKNIYIYI